MTLAVHYQPEVSLIDGSLSGIEALTRWMHPVFGLIAAERFIAAAEHGGFGTQLAQWLLQRACRDCVELQAACGKPLTLAVNLSPRQFHLLNLPRLLKEALAASGLPGDQLRIELTEDAMMRNPEQTSAILRDICSLGVTITLDNFGNGPCSIACLTRFPINQIKIDRTLVRNLSNAPGSAAMIDVIIAAAKSFRIRVGAVGIETRLQEHFLRERGCTSAQGNFYGNAVPASEIPMLAGTALLQFGTA